MEGTGHDRIDRHAAFGGRWVTGCRITEYTALISRDEYPTWTATVTGSDLPEAGHAFSSMSYARMCDEIQDWLEWHYDGEATFPLDELELPADNDGDEVAEHDDADADGDGPVGFAIGEACRFPQRVNSALERFWQAGMHGAEEQRGQAVADIRNGLLATAEDLARMLHMSPEDVRRAVERDEWRRAGLSEESWQHYQQHRHEDWLTGHLEG